MVHLLLGMCFMLVVAIHAACSGDDALCGYIPAAADSMDYSYAHGPDVSEEVVQLLQVGPPVMKGAPKQTMSPGETFVMYKHAHLLQQLLTQHGIVPWASGGTLLGAIRGGGIIPHDNDIDFTIFLRDMPKAKAAVGSLFTSAFKGPHFATYYNDTYEGSNYKSQVDLFAAEALDLYKTPDVSRFALQDQFHNHSAQLAFTQSLASTKFGCSTVMVPSQEAVSKQYLDETYGADWKTTTSCTGTWHGCELTDDVEYDLHNMALPCYDPEEEEKKK